MDVALQLDQNQIFNQMYFLSALVEIKNAGVLRGILVLVKNPWASSGALAAQWASLSFQS